MERKSRSNLGWLMMLGALFFLGVALAVGLAWQQDRIDTLNKAAEILAKELEACEKDVPVEQLDLVVEGARKPECSGFIKEHLTLSDFEIQQKEYNCFGGGWEYRPIGIVCPNCGLKQQPIGDDEIRICPRCGLQMQAFANALDVQGVVYDGKEPWKEANQEKSDQEEAQ